MPKQFPAITNLDMTNSYNNNNFDTMPTSNFIIIANKTDSRVRVSGPKMILTPRRNFASYLLWEFFTFLFSLYWLLCFLKEVFATIFKKKYIFYANIGLFTAFIIEVMVYFAINAANKTNKFLSNGVLLFVTFLIRILEITAICAFIYFYYEHLQGSIFKYYFL